jgi:hypothetical protein
MTRDYTILPFLNMSNRKWFTRSFSALLVGYRQIPQRYRQVNAFLGLMWARFAPARILNLAYHTRMPRNPHTYYRDQSASDNWESEFGFGVGRFPDPSIDFSAGGSKSRIPIADPDVPAQLLRLAAGRRTDLSDANATDPADIFVAGNPDRYGAQPPLVRERRRPKRPKRDPQYPARMVREW